MRRLLSNYLLFPSILLFLLFSGNLSYGLAAGKGAIAAKDSFVTDLLRRMTIDEKIGQLTQFAAKMDQTGSTVRDQYEEDILNGRVGSIFNAYSPTMILRLQKMATEKTGANPLGIPLLVAYDVIHGYRTIFPIPLAESSSWDLGLMQRTAEIAAKEASADGIHWTFSPMVDISRDPRWGRVSEGAGEDPWLGSEIAKVKVRGYQGTSFSNPETLMACVKHFALYGAVMGGRDYNTVDMSPRAMNETYFPPYRAAVDAGAATVMTSFNDINGVPATANRWLINDVLRMDWKFNGFVVTDYTAINELIAHHAAKNGEEAAFLAMSSGIDMDMQGASFNDHLAHLVVRGEIPEQSINDAARRILNAKYDLGLFTDPYRQVSEERSKRVLMHPDHLSLAREIGRQSIVLLKNEASVLPLKAGSKIALVGPLADNQRDLIGSWSATGDWKRAVAVSRGLEEKKAAHNLKIGYQKGANLIDDPTLLTTLNHHGAMIELDPRTPEKMIADAVTLAKKSDIVVAVMGESHSMTGEASSRAEIGLPPNQLLLLAALAKTKKPVVLVLMNGRPMTLRWEQDHMNAILETWFLGTEAGHSIADVLVGDYNPSGKLTISFPESVGQIPIFYASRNTGRPAEPGKKIEYRSAYLDIPNEPLYPFGYGLSYTKFTYGKLSIDQTNLSESQPIHISIPVTNAGDRAGTEIVQLYVHHEVLGLTLPMKELKGFRKINLAPHQTETVNFTLTNEDLKFYDINLKKISKAGAFQIMVGPNSATTFTNAIDAAIVGDSLQ